MNITLALILAGVAAAIAGLYVLMIRSRKSTYRKMAQALKADYVSQGAFKTGKITGTTHRRTFTVEPFTTGGGGSSTFWTRISIGCVNTGIPLAVRADFFKAFPNWKAVSTRGERKERVFFWHITLKTVLLDDKYKDQVLRAFQGIETTTHDHVRKGDFELAESTLTFTTRGIIKNSATIQNVLEVLNTIAGRIEARPIEEIERRLEGRSNRESGERISESLTLRER